MNKGDHLMKLNVIFMIAAVYMGLIGIGHLLAPVAMSAGVIPADASSGVVAFLRHYAALFIAIAAMNFMARNSEPSAARNAIVLANIVAFGLAAILDVLTVASGAGVTGLLPAAINLVIAVTFFRTGWMSMSTKTS
jgi:hypothetical protein